MAVTLMEAVAALNATLQGLLPAGGPPAQAPRTVRQPAEVAQRRRRRRGGHPHAATGGRRGALRVTAEVVVRVKAETVAQLAAKEAALPTALLGADPVNLRTNGVFRIQRVAETTEALGDRAAGPLRTRRQVRSACTITKQPEVGEGVISEVPVDLIQRTSSTPGPPKDLLLVDFETDPLALFDVVNDTGLNEPGQWQYVAAEREVRQMSGAGGGSNNFNASKRGTVACSCVPRPRRPFAQLRAVHQHAQRQQRRHRPDLPVPGHRQLLLRAPARQRQPARAVRLPAHGQEAGGCLLVLESGGGDEVAGYTPNQWFTLRLAVQDEQFDLAIDGVEVLSGRDSGITSPGRVGFMSRSDAGARFRFLHWVAL